MLKIGLFPDIWASSAVLGLQNYLLSLFAETSCNFNKLKKCWGKFRVKNFEQFSYQISGNSKHFPFFQQQKKPLPGGCGGAIFSLFPNLIVLLLDKFQNPGTTHSGPFSFFGQTNFAVWYTKETRPEAEIKIQSIPPYLPSLYACKSCHLT
jgi:hypothetical protein